jgi:hypothetical protein
MDCNLAIRVVEAHPCRLANFRLMASPVNSPTGFLKSCVSSTSVRARTHIKLSYRVFRRATGEVKACVPADLVANMYSPHIRIQMKKEGEQMCLVLCRIIPSKHSEAYGYFPPLFMSIGTGIRPQTACGFVRQPLIFAPFFKFNVCTMRGNCLIPCSK